MTGETPMLRRSSGLEGVRMTSFICDAAEVAFKARSRHCVPSLRDFPHLHNDETRDSRPGLCTSTLRRALGRRETLALPSRAEMTGETPVLRQILLRDGLVRFVEQVRIDLGIDLVR